MGICPSWWRFDRGRRKYDCSLSNHGVWPYGMLGCPPVLATRHLRRSHKNRGCCLDAGVPQLLLFRILVGHAWFPCSTCGAEFWRRCKCGVAADGWHPSMLYPGHEEARHVLLSDGGARLLTNWCRVSLCAELCVYELVFLMEYRVWSGLHMLLGSKSILEWPP